MLVTKQTVADKIAAYLHHEMTLAQLVNWAEQAMMDGDLAERDAKTLSTVIARLDVPPHFAICIPHSAPDGRKGRCW